MNVPVRPTVPAGGVAVRLALAGVFASLAAAAGAQSQPAVVDSTAAVAADPAIRPDLTVLDSAGGVLGKVEHVFATPAGGIRQVLVRTGGVARVRSSLKALPAAGLTMRGTDAVASLTREELQALPDATAPEQPTAAP